MQSMAEQSRYELFTLKLELTTVSKFKPQQNNVPVFSPPANKHKLPTDVAAREWRATLSRAVDHVHVVLLYTSTASEAPPAIS
jgi:hypothetical protein